jgi:hypothetical protein
LGQSLPRLDPAVSDPEMDLEEPIYLHLSASSEVLQEPAGMVAPWNERICFAAYGGTVAYRRPRCGPLRWK